MKSTVKVLQVIIFTLIIFSFNRDMSVAESLPITINYNDIAVRVDNLNPDLKIEMLQLVDFNVELRKLESELVELKNQVDVTPEEINFKQSEILGVKEKISALGKRNEGFISATKTLFTGYIRQLDTLDKLKFKIEDLNRGLKKINIKYKRGKVGKAEVEEAEEEFEDAMLSLEEEQLNKDDLLQRLKYNLGIGTEQELLLGALPEPNLEFYKGVNINSDIISATEKSKELKVLRDEYNKSSSHTEYERQKFNLDYKNAKVKFENSVREKYKNLISKVRSIRKMEKGLVKTNKEVRKLQIQYRKGKITKNVLEKAVFEEKSAQLELRFVKTELYEEILAYDSLVKTGE